MMKMNASEIYQEANRPTALTPNTISPLRPIQKYVWRLFLPIITWSPYQLEFTLLPNFEYILFGGIGAIGVLAVVFPLINLPTFNIFVLQLGNLNIVVECGQDLIGVSFLEGWRFRVGLFPRFPRLFPRFPRLLSCLNRLLSCLKAWVLETLFQQLWLVFGIGVSILSKFIILGQYFLFLWGHNLSISTLFFRLLLGTVLLLRRATRAFSLFLVGLLTLWKLQKIGLDVLGKGLDRRTDPSCLFQHFWQLKSLSIFFKPHKTKELQIKLALLFPPLRDSVSYF